jgi:hypothetical protein
VTLNSPTTIERLRQLTTRLESVEKNDDPLKLAFAAHILGVPRDEVKYLGRGQELGENDVTLGIYAMGRVSSIGSESPRHEVIFHLVSPTDDEGLRHSAGHFAIHLTADGDTTVSAYSFDQVPGQVRLSPELLLAPLGEWAVGAALVDLKAYADSKLDGELAPSQATPIPQEGLAAIEAFVDSADRSAFFRFNYGADRYANGIVLCTL